MHRMKNVTKRLKLVRLYYLRQPKPRVKELTEEDLKKIVAEKLA